jgi:hypothetical protein
MSMEFLAFQRGSRNASTNGVRVMWESDVFGVLGSRRTSETVRFPRDLRQNRSSSSNPPSSPRTSRSTPPSPERPTTSTVASS